MLARLSLLFLLPFTGSVFAQNLFSAEEVHQHSLMVGRIADEAAKCLDDTYADHIRFYNEWHVSKYYGNRRPDYATKAGRVAAMMALGIPAARANTIADLQVSTACITMAMRCLGQGFAAAGMKDTWDKIYRHEAVGNNFLGTELQKTLRQLGWKTYYWNPDPSQNAAWDAEDRRLNPLKPGKSWNPVWGGHALLYNEVMKQGTYHGIPIDDAKALVGFGKNEPSSFQKVAFFIGTAHSGYHVFPGRRGEVIEAHSTRQIDSIDNMQFNRFSPVDGVGPKWTAHEHYRSGVIVVPEAF